MKAHGSLGRPTGALPTPGQRAAGLRLPARGPVLLSRRHAGLQPRLLLREVRGGLRELAARARRSSGSARMCALRGR
jgi:hypothetical protein